MKKILTFRVISIFILLIASNSVFSQGVCPAYVSVNIGGWSLTKNGCSGVNTIDLCSVNGQIKKVPITFCVTAIPASFPAKITIMQRSGTGPFTWTTRPDMPPIILTGVDPITTCTTICVPMGEGTFSFSCNFGYTSANPCTDAYDFLPVVGVFTNHISETRCRCYLLQPRCRIFI